MYLKCYYLFHQIDNICIVHNITNTHYLYFIYFLISGEDSDSYFSSFSFIKSSKELLKFNKNNELNIINGFKFVTMIFILFGHRFMFFAGHPITYSEAFEKVI